MDWLIRRERGNWPSIGGQDWIEKEEETLLLYRRRDCPAIEGRVCPVIGGGSVLL